MRRGFLGLAAGIVFGIANTTIASPIFLIETGPQWQAALNDGRVAPITDYADVEAGFPGRASDFAVPTLTVVGDSLLEDYGSNDHAVGGFEYTYPTDPDLNGMNISYKADPGANINYLIALVDYDPSRPPSLVRTYKHFRFTSPPGGGSVNLNFPAGATDPASVGANSIFTSPGFRLSHVTSITYYSADGMTKITSEINMVPEPAGIVVAGLIAMPLLMPIRFRRCGHR